MHDHRSKVRGHARPDHIGDIVPIAGGGHAGPAELEDDPGLIRFQLVVFENIAQFFFQLAFGEYVFHAAPGRLAAFAGRRGGFGAPFGALQQGIEVVLFFGFPEKLIVDIEMFVFAFAHCSRKALEINRIDQLKS
jgi:hypothetical protein